MNWNTIETAPMDCKVVLLYRSDQFFVGYYGGVNSSWRHAAPLVPAIWPIPTHWMPLPEPPEQEATK